MNTPQSPRYRPFVHPQLPAPPMHRVAVDNAWLENSEVRVPYCDGTAVLRDRARELGVDVLPTGEPHAIDQGLARGWARVGRPGPSADERVTKIHRAIHAPLSDDRPDASPIAMRALRAARGRELVRVVWGLVAMLAVLAALALAPLLAGCGLPQGPVGSSGGTQGSGGGSGSSGALESSGDGGSAFEPGSSGGSGSGSGSGGPSESSEGGSSGEPACMVDGVECLCDGEVADPFECVDECLWVDAPPDCHCDGQTAPAEWCELAPCVLVGQGDDLECLCAGLPSDHLLCVTECHMSGDTCLCGNEPAPIEWCDL